MMASPTWLVGAVDQRVRRSLEAARFTYVRGIYVRAATSEEVWPTVSFLRIRNRSDVSYRLDPTIGVHIPSIETTIARWLAVDKYDKSSLTLVARFDILCHEDNFLFSKEDAVGSDVDRMVKSLLLCGQSTLWTAYTKVDRAIDDLRDNRYAAPYRRDLGPAAAFFDSGDKVRAQRELDIARERYGAAGRAVPQQLADAMERAVNEIGRADNA